MRLSDAGLREQPFRGEGEPIVALGWRGRNRALEFLSRTYANEYGLGLLHGPAGSGKTTLLAEFGRRLGAGAPAAIVDAAGHGPRALLGALLGAFGYDLRFDSINEQVNMLKVFVRHQAASGHPPLVIIENTHAMNPGALEALCELAVVEVRGAPALRFVLASNRPLEAMMRAPALARLAARVTGSHELEPMTVDETVGYVHDKLRAAGCPAPAAVVPDGVCRGAHQRTAGWPGGIDRLMQLALAGAARCPVTLADIEQAMEPEEVPTLVEAVAPAAPKAAEPPRLFVSHNGLTLRELRLDSPRLLVGRSEHNDLALDSRFISRHHLLFVRNDNGTLLMDLNSTNGTFVNSRRVSNLMLRHDDVILLGNHRIKFIDPSATTRPQLDDSALGETLGMKSLEDIRTLFGQRNAGSEADGEAGSGTGSRV